MDMSKTKMCIYYICDSIEPKIKGGMNMELSDQLYSELEVHSLDVHTNEKFIDKLDRLTNVFKTGKGIELMKGERYSKRGSQNIQVVSKTGNTSEFYSMEGDGFINKDDIDFLKHNQCLIKIYYHSDFDGAFSAGIMYRLFKNLAGNNVNNIKFFFNKISYVSPKTSMLKEMELNSKTNKYFKKKYIVIVDLNAARILEMYSSINDADKYFIIDHHSQALKETANKIIFKSRYSDSQISSVMNTWYSATYLAWAISYRYYKDLGMLDSFKETAPAILSVIDNRTGYMRKGITGSFDLSELSQNGVYLLNYLNEMCNMSPLTKIYDSIMRSDEVLSKALAFGKVIKELNEQKSKFLADNDIHYIAILPNGRKIEALSGPSYATYSMFSKENIASMKIQYTAGCDVKVSIKTSGYSSINVSKFFNESEEFNGGGATNQGSATISLDNINLEYSKIKKDSAFNQIKFTYSVAEYDDIENPMRFDEDLYKVFQIICVKFYNILNQQ